MSLPQFQKEGKFNLDYRLTSTPLIKDGTVDFDLFFDLGAEGNRCSMMYDKIEVDFENYSDKYI